MDTVELRVVSPAEPDAVRLIGELDLDLAERYPGARIHGIDAAEFMAAGGCFVLACVEGVAAACGAIRPLEGETAEVKRMFVSRPYRGRGLARRILGFLEDTARGRGIRVARLETGERQPEAIALYRSCGYAEIPLFGGYVGNPHSRCFEKAL